MTRKILLSVILLGCHYGGAVASGVVLRAEDFDRAEARLGPCLGMSPLWW